MQLKREFIQKIAQDIINALTQQKVATLKADLSSCQATVQKLLIKTLDQENQLDKQALELLKEYERKAPGAIDRVKMLAMIKKELQKKKK